VEEKKRTPAPRLNFTIKSIEALPPAPKESKGGRVEYRDTVAPGLVLRVTTGGVKTFSYIGRAKGGTKAERSTIGRFPVVKPEQARTKAWELAGTQASGASVTKAARERRAEMTVEALKDKYVKKLKVEKAKRIQDFEDLYARYIGPHFGKKRLSDIEREQVKEWHQQLPAEIMKRRNDQAESRAEQRAKLRAEIVDRQLRTNGRKHGPEPKERPTASPTSTVVVTGQGAANHALDALRAMFNYAILEKYHRGENPAAQHTKYPMKERERFLLPGEAAKFFEALMEEPNVTARDCIMMKLLTGARRANMHEMRWNEIDWTDHVWRIPDTKNGTSQTVPLVPEAMELLKQRKEARQKGCEWVFPASRSDSKSGHIGNIKSQWKRVMLRSGLKNLRQHDLRRTLGSWQARNGATLLLIGKSLNHKHPSSTAIYSRLDLDPVRASVQQATSAIFEAAGLTSPAEIIQMPVQPTKTRKRG
jgi:integrase